MDEEINLLNYFKNPRSRPNGLKMMLVYEIEEDATYAYGVILQ